MLIARITPTLEYVKYDYNGRLTDQSPRNIITHDNRYPRIDGILSTTTRRMWLSLHRCGCAALKKYQCQGYKAGTQYRNRILEQKAEKSGHVDP